MPPIFELSVKPTNARLFPIFPAAINRCSCCPECLKSATITLPSCNKKSSIYGIVSPCFWHLETLSSSHSKPAIGNFISQPIIKKHFCTHIFSQFFLIHSPYAASFVSVKLFLMIGIIDFHIN